MYIIYSSDAAISNGLQRAKHSTADLNASSSVATYTHTHTHTDLRMHPGGANPLEITKKEGAAVDLTGPEAKGLEGVPGRIRKLRGKRRRTLDLETMIFHFR